MELKTATPDYIRAVELALQEIEREVSDHLDRKANDWIFILGLFKKMERDFLCLDNTCRQPFVSRHRALVSRLMGVGDSIAVALDGVGDRVKIGEFSRSVLLANIRYIREKHAQWYCPVSDEIYSRYKEATVQAEAEAAD